MKIRHLHIPLAGFVALAALGAQGQAYEVQPESATGTRAEVRAGAVAATPAPESDHEEGSTTATEQAFLPSKTRDEVRAEAIAAIRSDEIERSEVAYSSGDKHFVPSMSRAQVRAEAIEAARLAPSDEGDAGPQLSPEQLEAIRQAGLRAEPQVIGGTTQ